MIRKNSVPGQGPEFLPIDGARSRLDVETDCGVSGLETERHVQKQNNPTELESLSRTQVPV